MRWLLILLIVISALEIGVFVWAGEIIGPWWVVIIIFLTGFIGIALAKQQGIETWAKAQEAIKYRQVPIEQIMNGICILIGAVFLITPGFITDFFGFLLVIPTTRQPFKKGIEKLFKWFIEKGTIIRIK